MKQGKRLKRWMREQGLDVDKWLYTKNMPGELHLVHKITGAVKIIKKEGVYYGK